MSTLVLGAGISGAALIRLLGRDDIAVYDERATGSVEGVAITSGEWDAALLEGVDLVAASPGFPEHSAPIVDALDRGIAVRSELELAAAKVTAPMAAVTGTNGKTTVTSLVAAMLDASGLRAAAVGNIGTPLSDVAGADLDVVVVEASSFQLRFTDRFRPDVAVVLDIAEDHLDWHGSFQRYVAAKAAITARQTEADTIVFAADDPVASGIASTSAALEIPVSGRRVPEGGAGIADGHLFVGGHVVALPPDHKLDAAYGLDVAAAAAAALAMGATVDGIEAVATTFQPGRHRREVIGVVGDVTYVNDSKATNPHAALAAVRAFPSVVLIVGGRNKGLDLGPLIAEPNLAGIIGIGEAGRDLARNDGRVIVVESMDAAVDRATEQAAPGDTVLLAPGCASFDMFSSYEERGDAFIASVHGIMQQETP